MLQDQRLALLRSLDTTKTSAERNKLGQFATPPRLADEMVVYGLSLVAQTDVRYQEPGFGTGTFFTSLLEQDGSHRFTQAVGYEVDSHYGRPAAELYASTALELRMEDFTEAVPEPFDLLLCNPPDVRHHHLAATKKVALADAVVQRYGRPPPEWPHGLVQLLYDAWRSVAEYCRRGCLFGA